MPKRKSRKKCPKIKLQSNAQKLNYKNRIFKNYKGNREKNAQKNTRKLTKNKRKIQL